MQEPQEPINFEIYSGSSSVNYCTEIKPGTLNRDTANAHLILLFYNSNSMNIANFTKFCLACAEGAIDSNLAYNLLNRLDENVKLIEHSFNLFCLACAEGAIDSNLANNLLNRLKKDEKLHTTALVSFCEACAENALDYDLVNEFLINRWVSESNNSGINCLLLPCLLKACMKGSLHEEQVNFILENLPENLRIDAAQFNDFCDNCYYDENNNYYPIKYESANKLLSILRDDEKINKTIFEKFCNLCSNYIQKNTAKKLFEHKDFSFSEITQDEFKNFFLLFYPSAHPLLKEEIQKDIQKALHRNKIGLGVGIGGGTLGAGLLALGVVSYIISFFILPISIALTVIGAVSLLGFGGTTIYNGVKIHSKKQMINKLQLMQTETKTPNDNDSQIHNEEEKEEQTSILEKIPKAIDKSSDTGENNIIPKNQDEIEEEEEDKTDSNEQNDSNDYR